MATKNHFLNIESNQRLPGASTGAPTRAKSDGMARKNPADPDYNRTPAPIDYKAMSDNAWGRQNYGANGYSGPSSLMPGEAEKARGIDAQNPDVALDRVQSTGLRDDGTLNDQIRNVGLKNVEDAFGQESNRSRQASSHSAGAAKVPSVLGKSEAQLPKTDTYGGVKS